MPYKGKSIANAILTVARRDGHQIDPLKLQKLLYFANGYYLAETDGRPLINEFFEAWDYGPVIPTVYYEFREYGNSPISRFAYTLDEETGERVIAPVPLGDVRAMEIVNWVWRNYGQFTGAQLSNMTHKVGAPWHQARVRAANSGMRNERLEINQQLEYFRRLSANA